MDELKLVHEHGALDEARKELKRWQEKWEGKCRNLTEKTSRIGKMIPKFIHKNQ